MSNVARKLESRDEVLGRRGTVVAKDGAAFRVVSAGVEVLARKATGCLLEPIDEDVVLLATSGDDTWILTVLQRDREHSSEIAVDGDLRLRTAHGKVAIVAQDGIDLISTGTTSIVSNEIDVRARTVSALVEGAELVGGWLRSEVERVKVVAKSLDQVVERFSQRSKRSYREVSDFDQVKAGTMHHKIEKTLRVHAGEAAITADGIVKMDGQQIHVG
jgi:hypothetical protein